MVDGWTTLQFADVIARRNDIVALAVPYIETRTTARSAPRRPEGLPYVSTLEYDEAAGTMTDTTTGTVYTDDGEGAFLAEGGETPPAGRSSSAWRTSSRP